MLHRAASPLSPTMRHHAASPLSPTSNARPEQVSPVRPLSSYASGSPPLFNDSLAHFAEGQAELLRTRLENIEATLMDERNFWARERAVLMDKLHFAVDREEAKQHRLDNAFAELREHHGWAQMVKNQMAQEHEEWLRRIKKDFEEQVWNVTGEKDKAIADRDALMATLRDVELEADRQKAGAREAIGHADEQHHRLTVEAQGLQHKNDELRLDIVRLESQIEDDRRHWSSLREDVERRCQHALDERAAEWDQQLRVVAAEREDRRKQFDIIEGEKSQWRERHTVTESECETLRRRGDALQLQISDLEGRSRAEGLEAIELKQRLERCEAAQHQMRAAEASSSRAADDREAILRREIRDAANSERSEIEAATALRSGLQWRVEELRIEHDMHSQKGNRLEKELDGERLRVSSLELALERERDERARAAWLERAEADRTNEAQSAVEAHRSLVLDLERRVQRAEETGLQLQRTAGEAERMARDARQAERDVRSELKQTEREKHDQLRVMDELMGDTRLLAQSLTNHQRKASNLNNTIRRNCDSLSPSPQRQLADDGLQPREGFGQGGEKKCWQLSSPDRDRSWARGSPGAHQQSDLRSTSVGSSYVASVAAKYSDPSAPWLLTDKRSEFSRSSADLFRSSDFSRTLDVDPRPERWRSVGGSPQRGSPPASSSNYLRRSPSQPSNRPLSGIESSPLLRPTMTFDMPRGSSGYPSHSESRLDFGRQSWSPGRP